MQHHERSAWGYSSQNPYYDDHNQVGPELDPIFFQRRFIQSVENPIMQTNRAAPEQIVQQRDTSIRPKSNDRQRARECARRCLTHGSTYLISLSHILTDESFGQSERQNSLSVLEVTLTAEQPKCANEQTSSILGHGVMNAGEHREHTHGQKGKSTQVSHWSVIMFGCVPSSQHLRLLKTFSGSGVGQGF